MGCAALVGLGLAERGSASLKFYEHFDLKFGEKQETRRLNSLGIRPAYRNDWSVTYLIRDSDMLDDTRVTINDPRTSSSPLIEVDAKTRSQAERARRLIEFAASGTGIELKYTGKRE